MGVHASDYEPTSYSLWYEYVSGRVPGLCAEIDPLIAGGKRLSVEQTQSLYDRYVRGRAEEAVNKARSALAMVIAQMQEALSSASVSGTEFASVLETFGAKLVEANSVDAIREQVEAMVSDAAGMRASIRSLGEDLRSNQSEVERLNRELERLREDVLTDPLTGLVNRRGFDVALASLKEGAERGEASFSIVLADIDHFKQINDRFGHLVGDRVIQQVASILRSCTRGGDSAVRYGGEEFALLLPGTSKHGAHVVAENIRTGVQRAVIRSLQANATIGTVTISLGISTFRPGEHVEHCTQRADLALYAAKQNGRNCVAVEP